ncbi:DUF5682 family protein [Streptomyces sp. NPDC002004]
METGEPPAPAAVFLGVRHHSPACARLVGRTIEALRPAYVLVEGPADMNDRLAELSLGHELPVAVFSHYRDGERAATSWTPLCDYSPEWVALRAGRAAGADVRFIDLPAWHPAFGRRTNRYADAESRYEEATARLCRHFGADSVDTLWDRLFETESDRGLAERLDAYFALVRGDAEADEGDAAREAYMTSWVRAAVRAAGGRPVLVVTGGFHQPALRRLAAGGGAVAGAGAFSDAGGCAGAVAGARGGTGARGSTETDACTETDGRTDDGGSAASRRDAGADEWPGVPRPPEGALAGSYLVPYSFRQLDSFAGYQSGMPSPEYYQRVWEDGPEAAADGLLRSVAERLRHRKHPVSTADLVAARTLTEGLTALRGHRTTARTDVLDGLAGALIKDDLEQPLPWTARETLAPGAHPVVVEMLAACGGDRTGRLHPDTPVPPLVHDVVAELTRLGLGKDAPVTLDLTTPDGLERSRLLHRLRVLGIPGHERTAGPGAAADPVFTERWEPRPHLGREAALIEAGAFGARVEEAAAVALDERARRAGGAADDVARVLFDAVLCGAGALGERLLGTVAARVASLPEPGALGQVLATALGLWRHDRVYGVARDPLLASVVDRAAGRLLWLLDGAHGPSAGADFARLRAVAALRDAVLHAEDLLSVSRTAVTEAARRISADPAAPADLRGAAFGLWRVLGPSSGSAVDQPVGPGTAPAPAALLTTAVPDTLGDWLAGLFAVTRDDVGPLTGVLDTLIGGMSESDFLTALPALRQAFAFFPPREREQIAAHLLELRGVRGSTRTLLRTTADPLLIARARALEENVTSLLDRHGLRHEVVTP